jgi:type II secretion system protein N
MTPDRVRLLRKIALYAGVGLVTFVVALHVAFPYERAKEVAIRVAADKDLEVEIGSAGPAFCFAVAFHDIRVRTRPAPTAMTPTPSKPTRFVIDHARVSYSLLSLLPGAAKSFSLALQGFGGTVDIDQTGTPGKKGVFRAGIKVRDVNMAPCPARGSATSAATSRSTRARRSCKGWRPSPPIWRCRSKATSRSGIRWWRRP